MPIEASPLGGPSAPRAPSAPAARRRLAARKTGAVPLAVLLAAAAGLLMAGDPPTTCPPGGTQLTWENFALPFFQGSCGACHDWSNYTEVYGIHDLILGLVWSGRMPAAGVVPQSQRDKLAEWMACDLPVAPPSCPPGGTTLTYRGFGLDFFDNYCLTCHSKDLHGADRNGAPEGLNWDDYAAVAANADKIADKVFKGLMPPNGQFVARDDIAQLRQWVACGAPEGVPAVAYRRGDANGDGRPDLTDVSALLAYLFQGGGEPPCLDAADADGSGTVDLADAVFLLAYLFQGGSAPPAPFSACGTGGPLGCLAFKSC